MKATDLAYYAGIVDGEGCIYCARNTKRSETENKTYCLLVTVGNTCEWLCQGLKMAFGGSVYCNENKPPFKPMWYWHISTKQTASFLEVIYPYLHLKKPQAELAISFQKHKKKTSRVSSEYLAIEEDFNSRLKSMNKKGVKYREN